MAVRTRLSHKHQTAQIAITMFLGLICAGCFSVEESTNFEGTVAVNGEPMGSGLVTLVPIEGTLGKKISATIGDGAFRFTSRDGLRAGDFRVEIFTLPEGLKAMAEGRDPTHRHEANREIDRRYNEASTLTVTIEPRITNQAHFKVQYANK